MECLICGKPLQYGTTEREMTCAYCGETFLSSASCADGHYICDRCHAERGVELILHHCRRSTSKSPIQIAQELMELPLVHMPVSYTHLDVYKRQCPGGAQCCGSQYRPGSRRAAGSCPA